MIDHENVLIVINEIVDIAAMIIMLFTLIYFGIFLWIENSDVVRSRIFLKYYEIKKALLLIVVFAFILIVHLSLMFISHHYTSHYSYLIDIFQSIFGLLLLLALLSVVNVMFKIVKEPRSESN